MWPSGWVRTLFFNPTQPDGQNLKPSPRVRTPELVQDSGRTEPDHPDQPVGQEPEPDQPARTEGVHPAQPVGRGAYVQPCPTLGSGHPSLGSTQPDGHPTVVQSDETSIFFVEGRLSQFSQVIQHLEENWLSFNLHSKDDVIS